MSFLAVLFALLLEQAHPLSHGNVVHSGLREWFAWVRHSLDAGQRRHGVLVWSLAVALPAALAAAIHWLLWSYSVFLTFAWAVLVLYLTLGFRQFSHHFTEIRGALDRGEELQAREALAHWRRVSVEGIPSGQELLREVMAYSILAVHRHVLGVLVVFVVFWVLGLGPAGAVLFRLADHVSSTCRRSVLQLPPPGLTAVEVQGGVCDVARQMWGWINHWPARCSAMAFAIVGNFEEAVAAWRAPHTSGQDANHAVVLAAAAGALNVQLGDVSTLESTTCRPPELAHLTSLVGLVWRSVVLWMLFLALLTLANVLG
jgi:adenosylcobinamide-phosphate synthase